MSLVKIIEDALQAYAQEDDGRHQAVMDELSSIKELIMALAPEVQALHDAVAAQGTAIADVTAEVTTLEGTVTALQTQLAGVTAGAPIDAEDLAEIVAQTNVISASIQTIKSVMPTTIWTPGLYPPRRPAWFTDERTNFLRANPTVDPILLAQSLGHTERFVIMYQRKLGIRKLTSSNGNRRRR